MTNTQKERIALLRGKGESYAQIAATLYISENTVKSFCRRNKVYSGTTPSNTQPLSPSPLSICKQCEKEIVQPPKRKKKMFCSYSCRMEWWKVHPEQVQQKAVYSFLCCCCKNEFTAYGNKQRKFCSHACYINARFGDGAKKAGDVYE